MDQPNTNQTPDTSEDETKKRWTILSFDIGVKNLAFCMMNWDPSFPSGNRYNLIHWDCINLIPESESPTCQGVIKYKGKRAKELGMTEKVCGKVASFHYKEPGPGDNNATEKPYCKTHLPDKTKGIPIKLQKIAKVKNQDLNLALVQALDKLPFLLECDEVLLEHQPSFNPRMKNLSFMIYSYFVIRGFIDKPDSRFKSIQYRQINSGKKFSIYDGPKVTCTLKNAYDQNKFYSKIYCEHLIRNDQKWVKMFQEAKKKDDLADCFLQGAWFLNKHHSKGKKITRVMKKGN